MRRKYFFVTVALGTLLVLSTAIAKAQVGALNGHIVFKHSNGTFAPAAGAAVDVFRTDLTAKYTAVAGSDGRFAFAALPFAGRYVIAASLPNAQPTSRNNVRAGFNIDYELILSPGDSRRLTLAEISVLLTEGASSAGAGTQESAADKAKREAIEERNRKAVAINQIVARTFGAGNTALLAGHYDEAIAQYDEGLAADPDHGFLPQEEALLTNKAIALTRRGAERYNTWIKTSDQTAKKTLREGATRDWRNAFEVGSRAVALGKAEPADSSGLGARLNAARAAKVEAGRLLVRDDPSIAEALFNDYQEYLAAEPDEGRRLTAKNTAAQMLLDAGLAERAVAEFRKLVNENAYNLDAILGLGMALFSTGDQARFKEAAGYLRQFVKMAPDTHPKKAKARQSLQELGDYAQP